MDDKQYRKAVDECFSRVAKRLEDFDPDEADYSTMDGAVTIEFSDGDKFILSRQSAAHQIWLAAGAHGYRYSWDEGRNVWIDDKEGHELYARLAQLVAEKVSHSVVF
ncbi:MAG TPA: iron donor protein CyaY [Candidatus Binataceae bacterium]|nr:iron donor protein CyaY [Candidatus Binataceae bacterium]